MNTESLELIEIVDDYKNVLKTIVSTYSLSSYSSHVSKNLALFHTIKGTHLYKYFRKQDLLEHPEENKTGILPINSFSIFLSELLDDSFQKEILLIWHSKLNAANIINSNDSILRGNLNNLHYVGINKTFLISKELNKTIEELILPNINTTIMTLFNTQTAITFFVKTGFYINENILKSCKYEDTMFKKYLSYNRKNEILYSQYHLNQVLNAKNTPTYKTKI